LWLKVIVGVRVLAGEERLSVEGKGRIGPGGRRMGMAAVASAGGRG
jgi:hypothetical protein